MGAYGIAMGQITMNTLKLVCTGATMQQVMAVSGVTAQW